MIHNTQQYNIMKNVTARYTTNEKPLTKYVPLSTIRKIYGLYQQCPHVEVNVENELIRIPTNEYKSRFYQQLIRTIYYRTQIRNTYESKQYSLCKIWIDVYENSLKLLTFYR